MSFVIGRVTSFKIFLFVRLFVCLFVSYNSAKVCES